MTQYPTAGQIRAARAFLNWSMIDLARAAQISVASLKRIEHDQNGTSEALRMSIRQALEAAGVQFLPDDGHSQGLRLRS